MKKILLIATTVVALSGLTSMGQGYIAFQTPTRGMWDLFTPANSGTPKLAATMNLTFLWGTGSALITGIGATTPTNNLASQPVFTPAQAWAAILTDPNYHLGLDGSAANSNPILANAANGAASYMSAASFPLNYSGGASPAGGTVGVYVIGWDKAFATPAAAQAAGSAVGWSPIFQYALGASSIATVSTFASSGFVPFGVVPGTVPEPTTFALAGLGMAALLVNRRRK